MSRSASEEADRREHEESPAVVRVRRRRAARRRARRVRRGAVAAVALVVAVYALGCLHFSGHYVPGTTFAGIDASMMDERSLAEALEDRLAAYRLTLTNGSFELVVEGADLARDAHEDARLLLSSQNALAWPLLILTGPDAGPSTLTVDEGVLRERVDEAVGAYNRKARAPVSASIVRDGPGTPFRLEADVAGEQVDAEAVLAKALDAIGRNVERVTLDEGDLVPPRHRADEAETLAALDAANAARERSFELTRDGKVVATLGPDVLDPWLTVVDDVSVTLDEEALAPWADESLWHDVDTADEKTVRSIDAASLAHHLAEAVRTGESGPIEVPVYTQERYLPGGGTLADEPWVPERGRYLDVDKGAQVATLYDEQGGVLWESIVTTGNEATRDGTPVGEFQIYEHVRDTTLIGQDLDFDGEPDYVHHVEVWLPFNGMIGLHDADWRESFGGTEYRWNGSTGCVNLPPEAAVPLYEMTHVGEWVIVHT